MMENKETITDTSRRTAQQNKALWVYFENLAETLNDAGLDQRVVLKPSIQISWTKQAIHDYLWLPFQKALVQTDSTTKLLKLKDIDLIWNNLNRHLSEKFGVMVDFPSCEINFLDEVYEKPNRSKNR